MYKIYKLVDNTNGDIYIGITTQTLKQRLWKHKSSYSTCVSREIINNGDYKIELIEETDDKTRERYWIENTNCINKIIPGRTEKEYYENNRDKFKEYRENNREKANEYFKEYREKNREKILEYQKEYDNIKNKWYRSMCGNPYNNNMSLLKIDPNLFCCI